MSAKTLQNISIPTEKDTIFARPDLSQWRPMLLHNKSVIVNLPGRLNVRQELISAALRYTNKVLGISQTSNLSGNIIVTGHQPIWHHCGVWVKSVAGSKFARVNKDCCIHLVLDHDICNTDIIYPKVYADSAMSLETLAFVRPIAEMPLEFREVPAEFVKFVKNVISIRSEHLCGDVWTNQMGYLKDKLSIFENIADVITYLQAILNLSLGLDLIYLPVSELSESSSFLSFAADIITNAYSFVECYNAAIMKQIETNNISPEETLQQLKIENDRIELPFWLVSRDKGREPLFVSINKNNIISIYAEGHQLSGQLSLSKPISEQVQLLLKGSGYRLRPKAVTFTLFVRAFLADWFIHGVGGANYEYITDWILKEYFKIDQLYYGVVTTTTVLPFKGHKACQPGRINDLKQQLRKMKNCPEKYLPEQLYDTGPAKSMIEKRGEYIKTSRDQGVSQSERKAAWRSISGINSELIELIRDKVAMLEKDIYMSVMAKMSQQVCDYREFFFGFFAESRLREIIESVAFESEN